MGAIWLITGGVRSGKSRLAARLAGEIGSPVTFVATAEARDAEMSSRILAHQTARPADWSTIEEPLDLAGAITRSDEGCLVVDCLTLWVSNRLFPAKWPSEGAIEEVAASQRAILDEAGAIVEKLGARAGTSVVVTNEVGSGIIPPDPRLRAWEDTLGAVNSLVAEAAERLYLCVAGQAVDLKAIGAQGVGES